MVMSGTSRSTSGSSMRVSRRWRTDNVGDKRRDTRDGGSKEDRRDKGVALSSKTLFVPTKLLYAHIYIYCHSVCLSISLSSSYLKLKTKYRFRLSFISSTCSFCSIYQRWRSVTAPMNSGSYQDYPTKLYFEEGYPTYKIKFSGAVLVAS